MSVFENSRVAFLGFLEKAFFVFLFRAGFLCF